MEDQVLELLSSKKIGNFKKGVRATFNGCNNDACEIILSRLTNLDLERSWEVACISLKSLGLNKYMPARDFIKEIWQTNEEHSMLASTAAEAYVRIERKDLTDAAPVLEILEHAGYSQTEGALNALGYDKMEIGENSINLIIDKCWDFGQDRGPRLTDPRYGLAAACAGWLHVPRVKDFLIHCCNAKDAPLEHVAENSLKGKYVKLR